MELPISTIGIIVLLVIVTVAVLIFLISGVGQQASFFDNTSDIVIGNLANAGR